MPPDLGTDICPEPYRYCLLHKIYKARDFPSCTVSGDILLLKVSDCDFQGHSYAYPSLRKTISWWGLALLIRYWAENVTSKLEPQLEISGYRMVETGGVGFGVRGIWPISSDKTQKGNYKTNKERGS